MEKLDLFCAVGEADDDILEDAEAFLSSTAAVRKHHRPWMKWGSLAACAALAVCAVWFTAGTPEGTADPRAEDLLPPASQSAAPTPEVTAGAENVDRPAVEPAEETARSFVKLRVNKLAEEPHTVYSMYPLMADFVPMTRQELLDYYGVTLPVEELFPQLSAEEPEGAGSGGGIYRREGGDIDRENGDIYWDSNTFSFTSAGGVKAVNIDLDKEFHLSGSRWELPGNELRFTAINGWELALFCYVDEEGNLYYYTEFRQNGVNYCVTGKNLAEGEFAALLEALLEERSDFAPGEVRTFRGIYGGGIGHQFLTTRNPDGSTAVEESWTGPLFLDLDDGGEYSSLSIELTPEQAEQFAELNLSGWVELSFIGEPATIGTVWNQQLVSIEAAQAK